MLNCLISELLQLKVERQGNFKVTYFKLSFLRESYPLTSHCFWTFSSVILSHFFRKTMEPCKIFEWYLYLFDLQKLSFDTHDLTYMILKQSSHFLMLLLVSVMCEFVIFSAPHLHHITMKT